MANTIFQKMYDFFKNIKTPEWLSALLYEIQLIVWEISLAVGKEYINSLKDKIIEVAGEDISSEQKRQRVFDYALTLGLEVKDRYINLLIEAIYNWLKEKDIVK